jgi:hypothetical protein|tara:strand:- start:193 stop:384 length:192 start_codon:yes stop_codon:yes gene_type:complete
MIWWKRRVIIMDNEYKDFTKKVIVPMMIVMWLIGVFVFGWKTVLWTIVGIAIGWIIKLLKENV